MFSDHNGIKQEINKRKILVKIPKYLELNNTHVYNPGISENNHKKN